MSESAFGEPFVHRLAHESWAFYSVGVVVILLRMYARIRKLGLRGLDADDYMMFGSLVAYTVLIVTLNLVAGSAGSALAFPGEDVFSFTEDEVKARQYGAKIDLVLEQAMLNIIWLLKGCMLFLYYRLTQGLKWRLFVKILAAYTLVGYVGCQLAFFTQCHPFKSYWQIAPSPNLNCMVLYDYAIVQCIFNISSDVAMLLIPIPVLLGVAIPIRQKLILLLVFGMGVFVIAAALCTKIEFFIDIYSADYLFWYTREASVAVYVANLPCIWPLLRDTFPMLRSWAPGGTNSKSGGRQRTTTVGAMRTAKSGRHDNIMMSRRSVEDMRILGYGMDGADNGTKADGTHVVVEMNDDNSSNHSLEQFPGTIRAETTIEMHSSDRAEANKWV